MLSCPWVKSSQGLKIKRFAFSQTASPCVAQSLDPLYVAAKCELRNVMSALAEHVTSTLIFSIFIHHLWPKTVYNETTRRPVMDKTVSLTVTKDVVCDVAM